MLQYLINATAIWLISLVMFDAFLRKESYHSYNRFYLLVTFLAGALLPLWQWQGTVINRGITAASPLQKVIVAKTTIATAVTANPTEFDFQFWLMGIYLLGVTVALVIIAIDTLKLIVYYRAGKKSVVDGWTVVETNKEHAPFSFLKTLYLSGIDCYTAEEWAMITEHEERHTALYHIIDVVLMQLARIIFWFHPLVYLYNNRLLLVHEYQADSAGTPHAKEYGSFLIEQSIFQPAPVLSHSFNRSPIKNRIVMLTHTSSKASRVKMVIFIPVAMVALLCFTKNGFSQKIVRKGNTVTYKGNTFVYYQNPRIDTITFSDPVTGNEINRYIKLDPVPVTMNGEKIFRGDSVSSEVKFNAKYGSLRKYIIGKLADQLKQLPDGAYNLNLRDVVIDASGRIVYYDYRGFERNPSGQRNMEPVPPPVQKEVIDATGKVVTYEYREKDRSPHSQGSNEPIPAQLQKEIDKQLEKTLDNVPRYTPATYQNKKVHALYNDNELSESINIKDHKIMN